MLWLCWRGDSLENTAPLILAEICTACLKPNAEPQKVRDLGRDSIVATQKYKLAFKFVINHCEI